MRQKIKEVGPFGRTFRRCGSCANHPHLILQRLAKRTGKSACATAKLIQPKNKAIHNRERGVCFYCLGRVDDALRCLDHVVPQAQFGRSSYRNLVSCCFECNSRKGENRGEHFLRRLYRERRLTASELTARLRAGCPGRR